jgi:transcriptional regulator with XRE-family HTH domain
VPLPPPPPASLVDALPQATLHDLAEKQRQQKEERRARDAATLAKIRSALPPAALERQRPKMPPIVPREPAPFAAKPPPIAFFKPPAPPPAEQQPRAAHRHFPSGHYFFEDDMRAIKEGGGAAIALLRKANGWTLAELGRRVGLSGQMISNYEHNRSRPRPEIAAKLRLVLGMTTEIADQPADALAPVQERRPVRSRWSEHRPVPLTAQQRRIADAGGGAAIRRWRQECGWSQAELAERLGLSSAMISHYETGRCIPTPDMAITLCVALGKGAAKPRTHREHEPERMRA